MKSILHTSAVVAISALIAFSGSLWADDMAPAAPSTAQPGTATATETKTPDNNGPTAQGNTGTTGTPQQTKTGDTATTDKPLSNGSPNEGTKKHKKKKHHHASSSTASTNAAP